MKRLVFSVMLILSADCAAAEPSIGASTPLLSRPASTEQFERMGAAILSRLEDSGDDIARFKPLVLHIFSAPAPNAFAHRPDGFFVSSSLLSLVDDPSQYAFVLAHELAHLVQGTGATEAGSIEAAIEHEIRADAYAMKLLAQAGYDPAAGFKLLEKLEKLELGPDIRVSRRYPSLIPRLAALCRSLDKTRCTSRETAKTINDPKSLG